MAVDTFVPMLRSLSQVLDKGAQHAAARKFDTSVLVNARLAPDMYPLAMQVETACFQAEVAVAHLMGREAPGFGAAPETFDGLRARIERTLDTLQKAPAAAFDGAAERVIAFAIDEQRGFEMTGLQLLRDWALPHFYFHVVTAYDILRHNGVDLGKRDYLSHVGVYLKQRAPAGAPLAGGA